MDLINRRFDRLLVVKRAENNKRGQAQWLCKCDCGNEVVVLSNSLVQGYTHSCGCYNQEKRKERFTKHGHNRKNSQTKTYAIWEKMLGRCRNKNNKNYGGRGIGFAEEWADYRNFLKDMGECPEGLTLERKDNNGDYCRENCIWATKKVQANNRRNSRLLTHNGETKTMTQWSEIKNIKVGTIFRRINNYNWSIDKALESPVKEAKY